MDQWNPKYPYNLVKVSTQYSLRFRYSLEYTGWSDRYFLESILKLVWSKQAHDVYFRFPFSTSYIPPGENKAKTALFSPYPTDAKSSKPKDQMSTPNITGTKNRNWPMQKLYMHGSNTLRFSSESQEYMNLLLRSEVGAAQSGSGG